MSNCNCEDPMVIDEDDAFCWRCKGQLPVEDDE